MLNEVQTHVVSTNNNNGKNIVALAFDGVTETIVTKSHPFLFSARMTYTICAFLSMICQLCMRNTLNYVILFMIKQNTTIEVPHQSKNWTEQQFPLTKSTDINNQDTIQSIGELNWSRSEVIFLQGTFYYGYVLTLSIAGTLADRFGGKFIFVYSTIIQALIFLCMPFCARISYELMVAMQIFQGLVAGCNNPALYQLFSIWSHPSERTAALSFAYSGYSLGCLIIFPLCSYLCNFGWDIVFYAVGGFSLILGIVFQCLVYSTLLEHPRLSMEEYEYLKSEKIENVQTRRQVPWKSIMASCTIYAFVVTHMFHSYGILVFSLMLPRFLREAMNISLDSIGIFSSIPFLGTFLAQTLINPLIGSLISIIVIVGIVTCHKSQELLLIFLMLGFGMASGIGFSGGYWPSLLILSPSYAGLLSGIATSFATCSGFLAPIAIKSIASHGTKTEWNYVMMSIAVFYGLSATIYGIYGRSKRQHWDNING